MLAVVPLFAFRFTSPGPEMISLGPLTIRWYGFLIASAVLIGIFLSQTLVRRHNATPHLVNSLAIALILATIPRIRLNPIVYLSKTLERRRQLNPDVIGDLAIWLVIAAIPSARLYYVLFQWQEYAQRPEQIFAIWKGGIAIHGAILGGLLAGLIFCRINKLFFWQITDFIAPSLILGQAIGRWGNFFNSEAFGRPTDLPWKLYIPPYVIENGMRIPRRPSGYENFEYFHPTFLYESVWNLLVFGLLLFLFFWGLRRIPRLKPGMLFMVYLVGYSSGRIWIEGLRTDSLMLGPLRIAQVVSLAGIALGLLGLGWLYLLNRSFPDVTTRRSHPSTPNSLRPSRN
jgi:phosphatidylglycerol:prolipoprotein diacylglycerol transferase